jgi:hypothetical protein
MSTRTSYLTPLPLALLLTGCLPELPKQAPSAPVVSIGPDSPRTGDDLVATIDTPSSDADGDTVTYRWAWKQNGALREDLVSDTVPASETTKGENWEVIVTPNDGERDGDPGGAVVAILNTAPVVTVAFNPETPVTGDDLRVVPTATDADGDTVSFTYAWTLDGSPQAEDGATVAAERTEHGQVWSVTVTPADAEEAGAPVVGEVAIANDPPVMLAVTLAPEAPTVRDNVVAAVESADADGDDVTYTYTWFVDGTEVQSGSGSTLPYGTFAKHQRVTVEVVPNDGIDDGEALVSTDAVVRNTPPTATGARIDPATATEASTLTCLPEGWADADGDAEAWTYTWNVNGAEVAMTATLDGTLFDKGDTVRCTATPFDGEENGSTVTSAPLTIANTAPVLASATLSTTAPAEADTLSVTLGAATDADGDAVTYAYAWVVNGSVVATGSTLTGAHFDKGDSVHVVVTPTDGTDAGAPVTSDVATAVNTRPVVSGVTLSPGSVYTNDTLTATVTASDADGDTLTHTYAWYVEGALVQSGASSTLAGTAHFDRDEDVYVVVNPNDGDTDGASVTSSPVSVLNTAPTAPVVAITPTEARPEDDLTCAVTTASTDADGDAVTYSFAWDVDGVAYAEATDAAMTSVVDGADVGAAETWACEVLASDGATTAAGTATAETGCASHDLVALWTAGTSDTAAPARLDIDGDGMDEFLFGTCRYLATDNTLEAYGWSGGATFTRTWRSTADLKQVFATATADMDGDGDEDLAAASYSSGSLDVYRNDGGTLTRVWTGPLARDYTQLEWVDVDGDGDLDLAVGVGSRQPDLVYANDGSAGFRLWWTSPISAHTVGMDWADYDDDGDMDAVFATEGSPNVYVFRNDGTTLTQAWNNGRAGNASAAHWLDVDTDGQLDLIVAENQYSSYAGIWWWRNTGTSFSAGSIDPSCAATSATAGDWNADGITDLALACFDVGFRVYEGDGTTLALAWTSPTSVRWGGVAFGDVDGDADLDLLTTIDDGAATIWQNQCY